MARTRAPVQRIAALAAVGTLAGFTAFASGFAPNDTADAAEAVLLGARTTTGTVVDTAAAVPPAAPPARWTAWPHHAHGNGNGSSGASGSVPGGVRGEPGIGPAPAPEPPRLPDPCPCLLHEHDLEDQISRLLGLF